MHLNMSSESLQEILGTYSVMDALKKFARLDRPDDDLESSCVYFRTNKAVLDASVLEELAAKIEELIPLSILHGKIVKGKG
jgi:hypothetical protein